MKRPALLIFTLLGVIGLAAAPVRQGPIEAELVSGTLSVKPGRPFTVALRLKAAAHTHLAWLDAASHPATTLEWQLPPGFKASKLDWPSPQLLRNAAGGPAGYGYDGENFFLVQITPPDDLPVGPTVTLQAHAAWLAGRDDRSPGGADLVLKLPVKASFPASNTAWEDRITAACDRLPVDLPDQWKATAVRVDQKIELHVTVAAASRPGAATLHFLPANAFIDPGQAPAARAVPDGYVFDLPLVAAADPKTEFVSGVIRAEQGWGDEAGVNAETGVRVEVLLEAAASP